MPISTPPKFKLPIAALPLLAISGAELSPLSPLRPWTDTPTPAGALEAADLIENGQLQPTLRTLADKLAQTYSMTMLQYQAGGTPLIWFSCFDKSDAQPISLYMTGDDVIIEAPTDIEAILAALSEMIGTSAIRNSELDLLIEIEDVYTWLSLADARRISKIESILGHNVSNSTISSLLSSNALKGQRLSDVIPLENFDLDNHDLKKRLTRLQEKELAKYHQGTWLLTDDAEKFIERLLLVDGVITLQNSRILEDNQLVSSTILYIQAGVNDFLAMEMVSDGLRVWSECATGALIQIRLLMQNAELIPWTKSPEVSETKKDNETQSLYCQTCHQPLREGNKFCTHCGTPVSPAEESKPETCPQCGHTPTPGAKFCGNCGFVLEGKS